MGYAVYHVEKGKGNANAIGYHIDRTEGKEHTYRQADPERGKDNRDLMPKSERVVKLQDAINTRIEKGYKGKRAIRKDAVTHLKHVVSGSHKDMKEMAKDKNKLNTWMKKNNDFMIKEFGRKNLIKATLHMDEKTPHIHYVTVPLTEDGRLSAKEVLGGRTEMSDRQTRYAEQMAEFGLKRGIKGTGIKHEDAKRYYGRIKEVEKNRNRAVSKVKPEVKGLPWQFPLSVKINKPKMTEILSDKKWEKYEKKLAKNLEKQLNERLTKSQKEMNKNFNLEIQKIAKSIDEGSVMNDKLFKENGDLKAKVIELDKKLNPGKYIRPKKQSKGFGMGMGLSRSRNPWEGDDAL